MTDEHGDEGLPRRAYATRSDLYRAEGDTDAPTVLFGHGTLMDRTMFDAQLDALSDDYHTVAYDLRARTEYYSPAYTLDGLADDAVALLDNLGAGSCVYVGMSMGGFVGLRLALRHPDRLDGLVLFDSMAGAHGETQRKTYDSMVSQVEASPTVPEGLARVSAQVLFGETTRDDRPDLVDAWVARWMSYPPEAVANEVRSWLDRDGVLDRAPEIDLPVLAVHGEEDTSIPVERARATVEALPDARLLTVPGAGHSSNLERPGVVNEAIRAFLGRI